MDTVDSIPIELFDTFYSVFDEGILILNSSRKICYTNLTSKGWLFENSDILGRGVPEFHWNDSQVVYAIVDHRSIDISIVSAEELPTVLLSLHNDANKTIVRVKEKTIYWNDAQFFLISLHDAKAELEANALQKAVFQISQAAGKATDLPALFKIVHETISSLIPTPNLFIATYDEISEFISFPYYVDERDYLDVLEKQKLRSRDRKVRRGLTEYLIHRGEPLLINSQTMDELTEAGEISIVGSRPIEWLGIPLTTVQGDIIGALVIQTYTENVRYSKQDVEILSFVSTQIAMAIQRKQSEELLGQERELFTLGPVVVFKLLVENNLQTNMVYVSPNVDQFGYSKKDFLTGELTYKDIIHVDDRSSVFKYGELNFVDSNAFVSEEYRIITKDGKIRWVYDFTYIHQVNDGTLVEYNYYIQDITEQKKADAALKEANENLEQRVQERTAQLSNSQQFLQLVIDTIPLPVYFKNKQGRYEGCNKAYASLMGITSEHLIGKTTDEIWPADQAKFLMMTDQDLLLQGAAKKFESQININGNRQDVIFYKAAYLDSSQEPAGLVGVILDITERTQFEKLQNTLYLISEAASSSKDLNALYSFVHGVVNQLIPAKNLYIALYNAETEMVEFPYFVDEFSPHPEPRRGGNGMTEHVIHKGESVLLLKEDWEQIQRQDNVVPTGELSQQWLGVPLQTDKNQTIGMLAVQTYNENEVSYNRSHLELLEFVSTQIAVAIQRRRAQESLHQLNLELEEKVASRTRQLNEQLVALRQREHELTSVLDLAQALRQVHQREAIYETVQQYLLNAIGAQGASMAILDDEMQELVYAPSSGIFRIQSGIRIKFGIGAAGWVINNKKVYLNNSVLSDPGPTLIKLTGGATALMIAPMIIDDHVIGMIEAGAFRPWSEDDVRIFTAMTEIAAYAIHRELLSEQKEGQLKRLNTLREIDRMITGNFDPQNIMAFLLNQIVNQTDVDAADILLSSEGSSAIDYGHGIGFYQPKLRESLAVIHPGPAEAVMINNEPIFIANIGQSSRWSSFFQLFKAEKFESYFAVPLRAKGQTLGALQVYKRGLIRKDAEWLEFIQALAQQTAIAIENAQLIDKLQKANREMMFAYDRTIEGWAKALEIRDHITGEHSQKVMQWTMTMAQAMGIRKSEELTHIKRGALLHDIGKMGISDAVLQKPGKLSDEEWVEMRKHPQYAFDLLYPIEFLRPALEIPLYHHERWDGSGYPKGLKGKEIPLSARIFTVIDVYNAITTERPYGKPWPRAKAIAYIVENSGVLFDPEVVQVFLRMKDHFEVDE
jgi:PAS domain S-box-containing protein